MVDRADMRCTKCSKPAGTCQCWTRCPCGWSYETGTACRNPMHAIDEAAEALAGHVAADAIERTRAVYPKQLAHPGFVRSLTEHIKRSARETITTVYVEIDKAKASAGTGSERR
jgi:hypothetical protein